MLENSKYRPFGDKDEMVNHVTEAIKSKKIGKKWHC